MIFLLLLLVAFQAMANPDIPEQELKKIANSPEWQELLHYKSSLFGRKSIIDGPDFFLSPEGRHDALAELRATLAAANDTQKKIGRLNQSPRCGLPARYEFLEERLGKKFPQQPCEALTKYMSDLKVKSLSLVFSSAYRSNPGSMFGHTFLKLNLNQGSDLLDKGVSFAAAVPDDENPFAFIYFGLTGGYIGQWSLLPYYMKVNEYVNAESRDLWEYQLNLSPAEVRRALLHLWEIETTTWLDYYFLDENCAYVLLLVLDVAKPGWNLSGSRVPLHSIPSETIKQIARIPNAISHLQFRPSQQKKTEQIYTSLNSEQRREFYDLLSTKEKIGGHDIQALDAAIQYLEYRKQQRGGKEDPETKARYREILALRAQTPNRSYELPKISENTRPDLGHYSNRVGASLGREITSHQQNTFIGLRFKAAYHDLLNSDLGFTPYSQIDFPEITLRYFPENSKVYLDRLGLITVTSLPPMTFLDKSISWRINLELSNPKDIALNKKLVGHLDASAGLSLEPIRHLLFYNLVGIYTEAGSPLAKGFRLGPTAQTGLLASPCTNCKLQTELTLAWDLWQGDRPNYFAQWNNGAAYSLSPNFDLRLLYRNYFARLHTSYSEWESGLNYYF